MAKRLGLSAEQKQEISRLVAAHGRRKVVKILAADRRHIKGSNHRLAELRNIKLFPNSVTLSPTAVWSIARQTPVIPAVVVTTPVEPMVAPVEPVIAPVAEPVQVEAPKTDVA